MELYTFLEREDFTLVENDDGKTLGVSKEGVERLLYVDGYAFKDLNNNGIIEPSEYMKECPCFDVKTEYSI